MIKHKLVILGDSFSHGIGTVSEFEDHRNKQFAYGKYIAEKLNLEYVNLAEPGISSLRISELGFQYIQKNISTIDLVIIGWTTPTRFGLYSDDCILQILPKFSLLGNPEDTDIFVEYKNNIKFITDKNRKEYLDLLPRLHKLMVTNNFLENQESISRTIIVCFLSWLKENQIKYIDFDVWGANSYKPTCSLTYADVIQGPYRHPTKIEQKEFSSLLIEYLKNVK